ncbi:hypothetical protein FKW77_010357 [Venturia effusa]|uniref:WW domain-containing oxidoreductase n=1 Tax=Venturia effusa TaxID=50376 RepID=A0A517L4E8_9PEZI|nr:hypothetical protein FKW77_010357 [Venturia effusa]
MSRYHDAHVHPQGPGDARPTALQIVKDEDVMGRLTDKCVLVTGASSGIGVETVAALHATGATVFATARDLVKGQKVIVQIMSRKWSEGRIHLIKMELDSLASVRQRAQEVPSKTDKMNVLVCNAGVPFPQLPQRAYMYVHDIDTTPQIMATPYNKTIDGFESQFATNHLSHFLLFQLLKPLLLSPATPSFPSRVVAVSSVGHRSGQIRFHDFHFDEPGSYTPWSSYGQSKTANIYFANEIERRYGAKHLHALSLHPGGIETGLQEHLEGLKEMMERGDVKRTMKCTEQGAATSVFAAVSEQWRGTGGVYLSDCEIMGPVVDTDMMSGDNGYAEWAFDESKAQRLWEESLKMVELGDVD